jgi:hypothetical protein
MLKNSHGTCKRRTQPITVRVLNLQQSFKQIKNTETEGEAEMFSTETAFPMNTPKGSFIVFTIFIPIRWFFPRRAVIRAWNISNAGKQSVL